MIALSRTPTPGGAGAGAAPLPAPSRSVFVPADRLLTVAGLRQSVAEDGRCPVDWARQYLDVVLPAVVLPAFSGCRTNGAAGNCLLEHRAGRIVALTFADPPRRARVNVEDLYGPLLAGHVERLARVAYAASGLLPRVTWPHARSVLAGLFRRFDGVPALAAMVAAHRVVVFDLRVTGWFPVNNPPYGTVPAV